MKGTKLKTHSNFRVENAPTLVPYLPIKDIADEGKRVLTRDMAGVTPPKLEVPMKGSQIHG